VDVWSTSTPLTEGRLRANPVDIVVVATARGRGVMAGVDGPTPGGVETDHNVAKRRDLLRAIGHKL
jgi:uncharacterized protein